MGFGLGLEASLGPTSPYSSRIFFRCRVSSSGTC
jgi:hypothetical protein